MSALAQKHRTDQSRLVALMLDEFRSAWDGPVPPSDDVAVALIRDYGRSSSGLAARYYDAERSASAVRGRLTVRLAPPAPPDQITRSLSWATRILRRADVALDAVLPDAKTIADGVARRLVSGTGRATILDAGARDRVGVRWARVCAPTACYFCQLMASRGAVYISEATARGARNGYHNNCGCTPQVVFPTQSWAPQDHVKRAAEVYAESTGSVGGTKAKLREFRRAFEGRTSAT